MELEDKKKLILESARYSFLNFGYKATTMELIAKTAKMGKGTFYNYFDTKEAVFRSVIDLEIEDLINFAEETKKLTPVNEVTLLHYLKQALASIKNGDLLKKLAIEVEAAGTPEVAEAIKRVENIAFQKLKELVILFIETKGIEAVDAELTTFLLLELYTALVYRWRKQHEPLSEKRIEEIFLKLYPLV